MDLGVATPLSVCLVPNHCYPEYLLIQNYWGQQRPGNEDRLAKQVANQTGDKESSGTPKSKSQQYANLARTTTAKRLHFHFCFQFQRFQFLVCVSSFHFISVSCFFICHFHMSILNILIGSCRFFFITTGSYKMMFPISYLVYSVKYSVCLLITYLVYSVNYLVYLLITYLDYSVNYLCTFTKNNNLRTNEVGEYNT